LSVTTTELLGNFGIKSCSTQLLKIAVLTLHSKIDTVSSNLPTSAPMTLILFDGATVEWELFA